MALFYQITYTFETVRTDLDRSKNLDIPFTGVEPVTAVSDRAAKAGLHVGDKVLSIDGQRLIGERDFLRSLHTVSAGTPLKVEAVPKGQTSARRIEIPADKSRKPQAEFWDWVINGLLAMIMLFCVVVGIYPAAVLPADARALSFFGLMLATSQVISTAQWWDFPRSLQFFAYAYHLAANLSTSIWLVCFALYFPEKFRWDVRRPWLKWLFLGPLIALLSLLFVAVSDSFFSYQRLRWVFDTLHLHATGWIVALCIGFFLSSIGSKMGTVENRDSRRRLRILLAGCLVSLTPLFALVVYELFGNWSVFNRVPETYVVTVCLLFCLFPITLAYVIVAERAMNLRMAIRQGVRYTFAKAGLRIVAAVVLSAILFAISNLVFRKQWTMFGTDLDNSIKLSVYVAVVVAGIFLMRKMRNRVMASIDRHFFREAYNAELILEELSDSVRSIVNEDEMLATVGRRISESLHVSHCAFLLETNDHFRPVYCLGFEPPAETALAESSRTVEVVKASKVPAPIYFDRDDNWVHSTPETELLTLKSLRTQILLPMGRKEKLLGMISLGEKLSEEPYSRTDLQLLRSVATQTGFALENSRLTKTVATEMAQREKLNREIEIAREVQERLFPQRMPAVAGIDYSGACRPALGVGGDYYDFLTLPNGDLGVAIGDVSGKGIAAALLMASLQASLRGQALMGQGDLAQLMTNVNQLVFDATPINRYATFFYGQYQHENRVFRYVNAGHNPPVVLRRSKDGSTHVIRLETGGPVVGLFPGAPYQEGSLILDPGDLFVGFTDGISEAMNNQDEEWGEERMIPAAAANSGRPAAEMIPFLMAEADRFAAGAPQHDDMTLIVLKVGADAGIYATAS